MLRKILVLCYITIALFTSCEQPVEYITEYVDVVEIVDNVIYTESIVYITKEVLIMSNVDPIKEYDNYITLDSKVLGVTSDGFEEIGLIKDLFRIDGVIYFYIDEVCYSQSGGVITEIESADIPEIPESEHITYDSGDYKITKSVYNDMDISMVYNGNPVNAYMKVDGACLVSSDLIYSVAETYSTRYKGIYIWTVNGNPDKMDNLGSGRIW